MQQASKTSPAAPLDPRRTYQSQELLKLVKTHPERARKVVAGGMILHISARQVAGLDTLLDRAVDDQGTVETSAMTGFETAMLVIAVATLVATVYGATSGGDGTTVTVTVTGDGDVNVNTGGGGEGEGHGDGGGGDGSGDTGGGG